MDANAACFALTEIDKLRADLAAAQRELAAWRQAAHEAKCAIKPAHSAPNWIERRVAELLAQEGVVVTMTTPNVISNEPSTALPEDSIRPIDRDEEFDRTYIPLPGGWEVQTKGKGSTFRICDTKSGHRLAIPPSPYLHETLEQMAREIHAAVAQHAPEDSKTVNAELYGLAVELADDKARNLMELEEDMVANGWTRNIAQSTQRAARYLSLREASGEPMPYKVVRDGNKVRFE